MEADNTPLSVRIEDDDSAGISLTLPNSVEEGEEFNVFGTLLSAPSQVVTDSGAVDAVVTTRISTYHGICSPPTTTAGDVACAATPSSGTLCRSNSDCASGVCIENVVAEVVPGSDMVSWTSSNWTSIGVFRMRALQDIRAEPDMPVTVTLTVVSSSDPGYVGLSDTQTTVIAANDQGNFNAAWSFPNPWQSTDASSSGFLLPEGSSGILTLQLTALPLTSATFVLDIDNDARLSVSANGLDTLATSASSTRYGIAVTSTSAVSVSFTVANNDLDEPRLLRRSVSVRLGGASSTCGFLQPYAPVGLTSEGALVQPSWTPTQHTKSLMLHDNEVAGIVAAPVSLTSANTICHSKVNSVDQEAFCLSQCSSTTTLPTCSACVCYTRSGINTFTLDEVCVALLCVLSAADASLFPGIAVLLLFLLLYYCLSTVLLPLALCLAVLHQAVHDDFMEVRLTSEPLSTVTVTVTSPLLNLGDSFLSSCGGSSDPVELAQARFALVGTLSGATTKASLLGSTAAMSFSRTLTLTFSPSDWSTPRVVRIKGTEDGVEEGPHTFTGQFAWSSSDPNYADSTSGLAACNASDTTVPATWNLTSLPGQDYAGNSAFLSAGKV